jgi:hypothetical protein
MTRPRGRAGAPTSSPADGPPEFRPRLLGALVAGALLVPLIAVALATALGSMSIPASTITRILARALTPTGWIGLPLLGAGLGALAAIGWAGSARRTAWTLVLALALGTLGATLVARATTLPPRDRIPPRSARGKARAILRAAFRSPAALSDILSYTRDPDPTVREQAVLALGVNLVVAGIERAPRGHVSRYQQLPLRDSLRAHLMAALADADEGVRAEAARALWKAPRTFGAQAAAAETLAAVLERALRPGAVERLAWLALDGAAGAPYPRLKAEAARFAAATPDSELARAARRAAQP